MKRAKNNKNKGNNNSKVHKQQQHCDEQQQQQEQDEQKQEQEQEERKQASVNDEMKTSRTDDVDAADTAHSVTSSVVAYSSATTQNIPANNSDTQSLIHSPDGADTCHVTNRCADDVISDVEVAEILDTLPTVNRDLGVTEGMTSDPGNNEVVTELIMAKTFTESTHPDREFVPIRRDTVDDSTTTLTVRCELVSHPVVMAETTSGQRVMTSSDSVESAVDQLRDLTSEFKHLQSLLDEMYSPAVTDDMDTSSSEEELGDDWRQPTATSRVVYHYHLHQRPSTTRRWIRRPDYTTSQELNVQQQKCVVEDEAGEETTRQRRSVPYHETQREHGSQNVEELKGQHEESVVEVVKEDNT